MARTGKSNGKASWVGQRLKRKEDPRLIQGIGRYVDDLRRPGMLHCAFVRSHHAHAEVRSINADAARALPGVVAVITAADLKGVGDVPCAGQLPDLKVPKHPPLADRRVRYVGEPVAAVVAEDPYVARDAAEAVQVDYQPLPAVVDMEKALAKSADLVHPQFKTNQAFLFPLKNGDVAGAFRKADKVVRARLLNPRQAPLPMEPRGVLAEYNPGEKSLTLWSSTQIPHLLKTQVALMLGMPETSVRVITPEVGGGFGSKLNVYAEEAVVPWLATRLGRPVKWMETRRENLQATIHGRDQIADIELAVKRDGTILALRGRLLQDLGAYHQLLTPIIPTLTTLLIVGAYKIPAVEWNVVGVFTNKMSTDAVRGAGRPESTYYIERMMDLVARELGLDAVEVRRRNFPKPSQFPFSTSTGLIYDSGRYQETLNKALRIADIKRLRNKQKAAWRQGRYYGIGFSTYVEICAMGPSTAMPAGGWESGTVRVEPTGKVTVLTGSSPHGQGQETSFAQIVADQLSITPADVSVVHGDTAAVPYGIGTFGSRATAVGGTAMYFAVQKVKEKMIKLAAHLMGVKPSSIVFGAGRLSARGTRKSLSFGEVVGAAYVAKNLPPGLEPGLEATHFFEPSNFTFPFGTHLAAVEVDAETGEIRFDKYIAVDDCGRVINPLLVEGQIHGGIAHGIGQALYEEVAYGPDGQLLSGSLMQYALPRPPHIPDFILERTVTPSPVNPMGVKGVGEAGTIASSPAVVNAVCDALSPLGIRHIDMPLKPEKVWRAMQAARAAAARPAKPARKAARRQV